MTPEDEDKAIKHLHEDLERGRVVDRAIESTNEQVKDGTLPQVPPDPIGLPELPLEFLKARGEALTDLFEKDMEEERAERKSELTGGKRRIENVLCTRCSSRKTEALNQEFRRCKACKYVFTRSWRYQS